MNDTFIKAFEESESYLDLQLTVELKGYTKLQMNEFLKEVCGSKERLDFPRLTTENAKKKSQYLVRLAITDGDIGVSEGLDILGVSNEMPKLTTNHEGLDDLINDLFTFC